MSWLKTVMRELLGIFIDDGSFALAIVAWLAVVGLLLSNPGRPGAWQGIVMFAGLAAILVESVLRKARKR